MISFQISFLIPPEVVPGRMALLITLILVLINLFISVTSRSPNTDSLTSISTWMSVCILFVCCSLFEYAGILLFKHLTFQDEKSKRFLTYVDSGSLMVSVTLFIIFNLIFWSGHWPFFLKILMIIDFLVTITNNWYSIPINWEY